MFTYRQVDGLMLDPDGNPLGAGYSGGNCGRNPEGKNNPGMEDVAEVGPLPRGEYEIGVPVDTLTHGPFVLPLAPCSGNEMFGRSGFLIHGDSVVNPGNASEGCIILARNVREEIAASSDKKLMVISGPMPQAV